MLTPQIRRCVVLVSTAAVLVLTMASVVSAQTAPYTDTEVDGEVITPDPEPGPDSRTGTPGPDDEVESEEIVNDPEEVVADPEAQDEVIVESVPFTGFDTEFAVVIGVILLLVGMTVLIYARVTGTRGTRQ